MQEASPRVLASRTGRVLVRKVHFDDAHPSDYVKPHECVRKHRAQRKRKGRIEELLVAEKTEDYSMVLPASGGGAISSQLPLVPTGSTCAVKKFFEAEALKGTSSLLVLCFRLIVLD